MNSWAIGGVGYRVEQGTSYKAVLSAGISFAITADPTPTVDTITVAKTDAINFFVSILSTLPSFLTNYTI